MILDYLSKIYRSSVPELYRKQCYKYLHYSSYKKLRTTVYPSQKGDFSLRGFDKRKAIFVHIPKAAGTSVALSIYGELPYHYKAIDYYVIFGRKTFNDYFKFCFVRNPWDRLYSAYRFLIKGGWDENDKAWALKNIAEYKSFDEFVKGWLTPENLYSYMHFIPQYEFVCDHRKRILVDYIGYFETINEDFDTICGILNIPAKLEHTNKSTELDYKAHYNEETIDIVAKLYQQDIDMFGYSFNGITERTTPGN